MRFPMLPFREQFQHPHIFEKRILRKTNLWKNESLQASSAQSHIVPIRMGHEKLNNHSAKPPAPPKILELQFRAENNSDPELSNQQEEKCFFNNFD